MCVPLTSNNFTMSTILSDLVFRSMFNDLVLTFLSEIRMQKVLNTLQNDLFDVNDTYNENRRRAVQLMIKRRAHIYQLRIIERDISNLTIVGIIR